MTSSAQSQDEDQIRRVMAERVTAMHDRDADRFVSHYAPEIVKFDLDPPLQHTAPEAEIRPGPLCQLPHLQHTHLPLR